MIDRTFHIEIYNIRWINEGNNEQDYCSHADIKLLIDNIEIDDPSDDTDPWCISTASLHLLRSTHENVLYTDEEHHADQHMIPHCGHAIVGDNPPIFAYGTCPIGINWSVQHNNDSIRLFDVKASWSISGEICRFPIDIQLAWDEYAAPICNLALAVKRFHDSAAPKVFNNEEDKQGVSSFWQEYNDLLDKCAHKLGS